MGELKTDTRTVIIGESRQDDGNIIFDVIATSGLSGGQRLGSDLPLDELLAELQKIPGVTAKYEKPRPKPSEVLKGLGLGAVFEVEAFGATVTYIKVDTDSYRSTTSNLHYGASQFDNGGAPAVTVLSEGYRP